MIATAIERAAGAVAGASLKSVLILAAAGLVIAAWRRSSASSRHLVWTAAVVATLVLPVAAALLPQWHSSAVAISVPPIAATPAAALPRPVGEALPVESEQSLAPHEMTRSNPAPIVIEASPESPNVNHANVSIAPSTIPQSTPPLNSIRSLGWKKLASVVWLFGFVMVLIPYCIGRIRLARIASTARRVTGGRWLKLVTETRAASGTRAVRLLESDEAAMPMTWGVFSPVLLLPSGADEWPEWKCRNILLHELAHIDRFDCLTQVVARLACALYWFNPLAWVAAQRMRAERELACDDRVIGNGSRPSEYAGHLLDVARSLRPARATAHAAIAMARPSQLSGRLTAVLDRSRNREKVSSRFRVAVAATTLGVLLPVATYSPWVSQATAATVAPSSIGVSATLAAMPTGQILPVIKAVQSSDEALGIAATLPPAAHSQSMSCWDTGKDHSTSIHSDSDDSNNNRMTVKFSSGDCTLELRSEGKFTLRSDLSDVASMDRNGSLAVEERSSGTSRRMEIRPSGNGLEHIYYVNGRRAEYSPDARAWLAQILLAVERRTAFAASTRVPQIFQERGAKGVLDEVSLMPSDYAKSAYLGVLLKQSNLDAPTLTRIVQQSQREMTSDYYLADVIGKVATQRYADDGTWRAFADASTSIKSDYYKAQVIGKVLSRDNLDTQTLATLLKGAATIDSDYYQAEVLKSMSKKYAITAQSRPYYLAALNRITSDYYRSEVLSFLNTGAKLDATTTAAVLKSISDMQSDYYKSQALGNVIKLGRLDASTRDEYFSAIKSIDSDYYKHEALNATLAMRPLSRETVASLLEVSQTIKSDYELSAFLSAIAAAYPIDDSLRPAFDRAVDSIQSDYYRGAALSAAHRTTR